MIVSKHLQYQQNTLNLLIPSELIQELFFN